MEAYKATTREEFRYRSLDGMCIWSDRYRPELTGPGWTSEKQTFVKVESHISPRHALWNEYRNAKRRATLLLAARRILKANEEIVPDKDQIAALLAMKIFRSHARTASAQKTLAYSSFRYLRKLENRLQRQPGRFVGVETWLIERQARAG